MGLFGSVPAGSKRIPIFEGVDSVIGHKAKFKGELHSTGSINVVGELEGKVRADGEVIISAGGKVNGEINAGNVVVSGLVEGNITAIETLEITKTGRVHGDLIGGKILIHEGSSYHGRVKVNPGLETNVETTLEPVLQPSFREV
jgi:cytoskeletal protein CcmA (bactofilin family)